MASTFTWLDYSEHERRKMLDVIQLFGERTTRDELGLGAVRDAFADLLFPGTSTIQTAARYFLFVPWIYLALEKKPTPSGVIADRDRKAEIELARELELAGVTEGVIGRRAKENLQRLPSSIYWQGLLQWGIRDFTGSQDEYHRSLDHFYARRRARKAARVEHDGESVDDPDYHNWHTGLPDPPADFPTGVTLTLRRRDATYLRERILTKCSHSLLAWLVRERVNVKENRFVWELSIDLPHALRNQVEHGRNFSEVMHGAQLLYNLILAELSQNSDLIEEYRGWLKTWWVLVTDQMESVKKWDTKGFWVVVHKSNPRVSPRATRFIDAWIEIVRSAPDLNGINSSKARELVRLREMGLKKDLSRVTSQRAREQWNGAAGAAQMDLRWNAARRMISDILIGLEGSHDA